MPAPSRLPCPLRPEQLRQWLKIVQGGGLLRRRLSPWGRIHIDRHLPFLCVYRRPPQGNDTGTERLLLGEAAYLLAPGLPSCHDRLSRLVREIAAIQHQCCGGFILLEIWADAWSPAEEEEGGAAFRILAPRNGAPLATLEVLEQSLLEVRLRNRPAEVAVEYGRKCAPPGMKPLLTGAQQKTLDCTLLGIAVRPIYRDPEDGHLYPFALRTLHRGLSRALKQGIYEYLRQRCCRPFAHYLELGRRAMTRAVWESDRRLAAIGDRFDLLLHVTPVNSRSAWEAFRRNRCSRIPEFHYRPRNIDPALLKRELYRIPLEHVEDPTLARLFEEKRRELDGKLDLLADRGRREFLYASSRVFGVPDADLVAAAREILRRVPAQVREPGGQRALDARAFARAARRELAHYRHQMPELAACVEVRDDVAGLIASGGHLLVASDARVGKSRVDATLQHEVGTHLVTYYNGLAQPLRLLHVGLAGYDETQEGLAVLAEYLAGGLNGARLRVLAGRVLAVQHLVQGADFIETYRMLADEEGFAGFQAFTIAMRVHRGGGLTKDQVYLRGLLGLLDYLGSGGALETLLLGKFALHQVPWIEELRWRRVLREPVLRPRYLDAAACRACLCRLREGLDLATLVEEVTR